MRDRITLLSVVLQTSKTTTDAQPVVSRSSQTAQVSARGPPRDDHVTCSPVAATTTKRVGDVTVTSQQVPDNSDETAMVNGDYFE